jgi:signal transduction histidine kinase
MNPRLLYPFLLAFGLLVIAISLQWYNFRQMTVFTGYVDHTQRIITALAQVSNCFKSAQIYTPNNIYLPQKKYYLLYEEEAGQVYDQLKKAQTLAQNDPIQHARVDSVKQLIDQHWSALLQKNIAELIQAGEAWRLDDLYQLHYLLNKSITYEEQQLLYRRQELKRSTELTRWFSIGFSVLAIGIIAFAMLAQIQLSHRHRRLEGFMAAVLNSSKDGIVSYKAVWDKGRIIDFKIEFANAVTETLLGIKPDQVSGRKLSEIDSFVINSPAFAKYCEVVVSGQSTQFETHSRRDDHQRWFNVQLTKLDDGLTATFHDITDIKLYQEKLRLGIKQLEESNKGLEEFAYVASHDLQEPLRKIQAFGSMLKEQYASVLGAQGNDLISRMEVAAGRMSALIRDLLEYSRLATRQQKVRPHRLNDLIVDVLDSLELVIAEKQAVVDVGELGSVIGDATQLTQLFQNLLTNALKFTKNGLNGTSTESTYVPPYVRIKSKTVRQTDLPGNFQPANEGREYRLIQVVDNGIGFDAHQADRIFGTFQRLHSKDGYPGTGIGLAIAKKVVENHQGHIIADGKPGEGATFSVYLPVN